MRSRVYTKTPSAAVKRSEKRNGQTKQPNLETNSAASRSDINPTRDKEKGWEIQKIDNDLNAKQGREGTRKHQEKREITCNRKVKNPGVSSLPTRSTQSDRTVVRMVDWMVG